MEDLKFVLKTINDIKDMSLEVEFQYLDIKERYRTLAMYKIEVIEKKRWPMEGYQMLKR